MFLILSKKEIDTKNIKIKEERFNHDLSKIS